jgi:hypothetical protein
MSISGPHSLRVSRACLWLAITFLTVSACGGSGNGGTSQVGTGTVTLSWVIPTHNSDGTVLANLSGFKVYYGNTPTNLVTEINITDPALERYTVRNLASGQYHFVIRSYNSAGTESLDSNIASTSVN